MDVGDCVISRRTKGLDRDAFTIERADPVIRIAAELLDEMRHGDPSFVRVEDDVITLRGDNRTVVYRLVPGGYDPLTGTHLAQWPD